MGAIMMLREKFFNNMKRLDGGYIPFEFDLCPSQAESFRRRIGDFNWEEYYNFPLRIAGPTFLAGRAELNRRFKKYIANIDELDHLFDFGVGFKKKNFEHFMEMSHAMEKFDKLEDFETYPYPNTETDYDWSTLKEKASAIKEKGFVAGAGMSCTIFEMAWYMRGMDNFMVDMALHPDWACYLMDRILQVRCVFARRYAQAGFEILLLGDDVSTQLNMMMSPEMWREFLKPRLASVIAAAKEEKPEILIFYHGDGNLQKIIPDLIEIGVDILNPVQPECMDPVEIKRQYGDKLVLWGTIGTQTTLPFGTTDEVRAWCKKMIREAGFNGGLCLAPTHMVEPEVPFENMMAFIETVQEHNKKRKE